MSKIDHAMCAGLVLLVSIAGCDRPPYSPSSEVRVMRQFYLECRKDSDQNACIIALRDEFYWAFGDDLEYAITGELAR